MTISHFAGIFQAFSSIATFSLGIILVKKELVRIGVGNGPAICGGFISVVSLCNGVSVTCLSMGNRSHNKFCLLTHFIWSLGSSLMMIVFIAAVQATTAPHFSTELFLQCSVQANISNTKVDCTEILQDSRTVS